MKPFILFSFFILLISCSQKNIPVTSPETSKKEVAEPVIIAASDEISVDKQQMVIAGQEIYNAKCGRCHGLKKVEDYTAGRWVGIMEIMAPKSGLNEAEKANILAYVQFYAKQGS